MSYTFTRMTLREYLVIIVTPEDMWDCCIFLSGHLGKIHTCCSDVVFRQNVLKMLRSCCLCQKTTISIQVYDGFCSSTWYLTTKFKETTWFTLSQNFQSYDSLRLEILPMVSYGCHLPIIQVLAAEKLPSQRGLL